MTRQQPQHSSDQAVTSMGVRIVEQSIGSNVIPLQGKGFETHVSGFGVMTDEDVAPVGDLPANGQPVVPEPRIVYGYLRVVANSDVRAVILKADLAVFCRTNGFMLSTVFTDFGLDDVTIARPGFSSLLDVCKLVGTYGVVVPSRTYLSSFAPTREVLTRQLRRTGAKLFAIDEVATKPSGSTPPQVAEGPS